MAEFWVQLAANKVLWVTLLTWVVTQGSKITLATIREKRFNFYWLLSTGGMPSSHSAGVVALAVCIGKQEGFCTPLFALGCIFAFVTMFDAQSWRRSVGVQARILNRMIDDLQEHKKITDNRLKELMGHTPTEVFIGALIGIVIPLIFYR
ncbi:MAG: divergent PAP2 family protein [Candidatus Omnitrophica bacterium]|nr:divergent PAP2 family protein [Candidatus Omnitrophota bacterium]